MGLQIALCPRIRQEGRGNAEFIANAPSDMAALLEAVRVRDKLLDEVLHNSIGCVRMVRIGAITCAECYEDKDMWCNWCKRIDEVLNGGK